MVARLLLRLIDAQAGWTRPLGDIVHGFLHRLFQAIPFIRDLLNGRWLGHPLHAVLTDVPIGILFLVIVFDVLHLVDAAAWALGIGILTMLAAALAGFADYADTDGKARERATLHSTLHRVAGASARANRGRGEHRRLRRLHHRLPRPLGRGVRRR
jgi:hypothetical protein